MRIFRPLPLVPYYVRPGFIPPAGSGGGSTCTLSRSGTTHQTIDGFGCCYTPYPNASAPNISAGPGGRGQERLGNDGGFRHVHDVIHRGSGGDCLHLTSGRGRSRFQEGIRRAAHADRSGQLDINFTPLTAASSGDFLWVAFRLGNLFANFGAITVSDSINGAWNIDGHQDMTTVGDTVIVASFPNSSGPAGIPR